MAEKLKHRGIFCIETIWYEREDQTSIRPMLEMLRDCMLKVPFIHRNAVTKDAFVFHVEEWLKCNAKDYPILYLGYHGEPDSLKLRPSESEGGTGYTRDTKLSLHDVAEILLGNTRRERGGCKDRLVHFASCSTLKTDEDLGKLVSDIKASAISGYTEEINWVDSAAFELLYLQELQFRRQKALTLRVMKDIEDYFKETPLLSTLKKSLGFKLQFGT